ncbi:NXNL2, partial [Symbiodinium microadriaticum]
PFTAILSRFFKSIRQQKGDNAIDVIFISSDQSENAMFEYFVEEHGDWMAIPYSERDIKDVMSSNFEITGIPGCKVVNSRMEVVPDIEMRRLLSALPDTAGPKLNVEALKLYEKLCSAVKSTDDSSVGLADKEVVDIFFSLRFGEAMDQAVMVRKLLKEQYDINGCIIEVPPGQDIAEQVAEKLNSAKMVLIFGTETYGTGTVNFSTKEELQFLMDEKKPFFLIKMCEKFSVARTRLSLSNAVSYVKWNPGDPVPDNLISEIANKFEDAVLNPTAHY